VLRTSFSFDKCKPGQLLHGEIDQEVPLANGTIIRKGSQLEGHFVNATAAKGTGAKISIQFDKLYVAGKWIQVVTNLRAIADDPRALWVISAGARGIYGIDNLVISRSGRSVPVGTIVLASQTRNLKLKHGDALLLLVD
jgi:hypothetical protein